MGGAYGALEGLKKSPNPALKIRFNSLLNFSVKRGSKSGNMLGVLGKELYTLIMHSHFVWIR